MSALEIVTEPNPLLHEVCDPVTVFDAALSQLIEDMRQTMHLKKGMGLAAPQIGRKDRLIIVEYNAKDEDDESIPFIALVNPRLTWTSPEKVTLAEGCLSLPGLEGDVIRPRRVRVKAQDAAGQKIELRASGLFARILQHEIDHLDGILYPDKMAAGTAPGPIKTG